MSSDRLIVKFSQSPSDLAAVRLAGLAFVDSFVLLFGGVGGIALFAAVQIGLGVTVYRYFRQRLELDPSGVTIVHVWNSRRIEFAKVLCITGGRSMRFVADGLSDGLSVSHEGRYAVEDFLHDHAREIKLNPVEPWVDRHGRWHGELHRADPIESIRSVRRAALGRWTVEVKVLDEHRFQASARSLAGASESRTGDVRTTVQEATDDAIAMIEQLRHE